MACQPHPRADKHKQVQANLFEIQQASSQYFRMHLRALYMLSALRIDISHMHVPKCCPCTSMLRHASGCQLTLEEQLIRFPLSLPIDMVACNSQWKVVRCQ